MKCLMLFSGKYKKNISLLSAEFAKRVEKVTGSKSQILVATCVYVGLCFVCLFHSTVTVFCH